MKKILYIRPSTTIEDLGNIKYGKPYHIVPLGILSIISYCRSKVEDVGFRVKDFCTIDYEAVHQMVMYGEIEEIVKEWKPDIVGISALSSVVEHHIDPIAKIIKRVNPNTCVLAGGVGASVLTKEEIGANYHFIDAVSFSEGEIPMVQLLQAEDIKTELEINSSFITLKNANDDFFIPTAQFLQDLDEIPPLPFELLEIEKYENAVLDLQGRKSIALHTVRGCPFGCYFCAAPGLSGKKLRSMSAERVLKDLKQYSDQYGYNQVMILDEQLLAEKDRAIKLLNGLSEMEFVLSIPNGMNIKLIEEPILKALKNVKMDRYVFALESGSQRVLDSLMHKPVNLEIAREKLKQIYDEEIETHSNFIIGMPGETVDERKETIEYIKSVALDWSVIFTALPIRGSELQKECEESGWLHDINGSIRIVNDEIDPVALDQEAYMMNLECNFVNNYAMRNGYYKKAKKRFQYVKETYPEQAFAHYYYAQCCRQDLDEKEYQSSMEQYFNILSHSDAWRQYAKHFHLPFVQTQLP